jgi:hypothetical protein
MQAGATESICQQEQALDVMIELMLFEAQTHGAAGAVDTPHQILLVESAQCNLHTTNSSAFAFAHFSNHVLTRST